MNVSCPECRTVYRVDPRKVAAPGVRARCARCPGVFDVRRPDGEEGVVAGLANGAAGPGAEFAADGPSSAGVGEPATAAFQAPPSATATAPSGLIAEEEQGQELVEAVLPPPPFGSADPHGRARRLARALVSDIVVYNPERRERSLREGTLRRDFRDEINKSWEEYVAQIGNQIARETSYFRDALNEILAKGGRLF
jgi:predicted Zn finger-like uncharacterized protein